ncbi:MAG: hypothetical protein WKF75_04605 [Singulisphaera sp.]
MGRRLERHGDRPGVDLPASSPTVHEGEGHIPVPVVGIRLATSDERALVQARIAEARARPAPGRLHARA